MDEKELKVQRALMNRIPAYKVVQTTKEHVGGDHSYLDDVDEDLDIFLSRKQAVDYLVKIASKISPVIFHEEIKEGTKANGYRIPPRSAYAVFPEIVWSQNEDVLTINYHRKYKFELPLEVYKKSEVIYTIKEIQIVT